MRANSFLDQLNKELGIKESRAARALRLLEENPHVGWQGLPKGWDEKSVDKFARSLTGKTKKDSKGFFTKCVKRLKDEEGIDNPQAFCAALKDEYLDTEEWRGGD